MNSLDAVYQVLADAREPLHSDELTRRIMERNLWQTEGKTPAATVCAQLTVDIKKLGSGSRFQRTAPGMFALRKWGLPEHIPATKSGGDSHEQAQTPIASSVSVPESSTPKRPKQASLSFTDAAEAILGQFGQRQPMHYREITKKALEHGLVETKGQTPEATLYAQVLTETQRRKNRGETPRFVMEGKGFISLSDWHEEGLAAQIERHNTEVRHQLRDKLQTMSPGDFEALIRRLLVALGFDDVEVTPYTGDGGIDVRGTLVVGDVIRTRMAVQVKRWKYNVQAPAVQQVRGSLGTHEQGLIITTSDFSAGAKTEAARANAVPVALMNGEQLVRLLVENRIGISRAAYDLIELDGGENDPNSGNQE